MVIILHNDGPELWFSYSKRTTSFRREAYSCSPIESQHKYRLDLRWVSPAQSATEILNPRSPYRAPLGCGYLVPWNAFITAVDHFSYIYPDASVDRIFAVVYRLVGLVCLLLIILYSHKSHFFVRINVGLGLFVVALLVVPVMDLVYIKGQVGLYDSFYVTVGAIALCGLADALVQGGVVGAALDLNDHEPHLPTGSDIKLGCPSISGV